MNYKTLSDEALLEHCRLENRRAFNELFDRYALNLRRLAMRYTKDGFAAEELALDLLMDMWERRHDLEVKKGLFSAYLFRAMHNRGISYVRRRLPQFSDVDTLADGGPVSPHEADLGVRMRDEEQRYRKSLDALTPQRRRVFELSRERHLSYPEIARELNLSINTVENHMQAALAVLRRQYQTYRSCILLAAISLSLTGDIGCQVMRLIASSHPF
jgi:RNA polymerase sigma-70 factor (ECF subfamily)